MRLLPCLLLFFTPLLLFSQWQNMNGPYSGGAYSYAGNGDYTFAANVNSVYRSADMGDTWEDAGKNLSKEVRYFDVQAFGSDVLVTGRRTWLYGADNIAAFLSHDNGDTWEEVPLPFYDAVFYYGVTLSDGKLFAANGYNIWERSLDVGADWTLNSLDSDPNAFYKIVAQDGRLYALGYKEIAVCPNLNGQNWTKIPVPGLTHVVTRVQARGDTIFVEDYDYRCYRTLNGGVNWKRMLVFTQDIQEVTRVGGVYYALYNYSHLTRSTDAGETWLTPADPGAELNGLQSANGQLFGYYYQGGAYRISADGTVFTRIGKGMSGGQINAFAQDDKQILLACGYNGLHRYDKQTQTWSDTSRFPALLNVFAAATDGDRIYAGIQYGRADSCIFRSDDGGQTWLNISPDLDAPFPESSANIQRIIATPKALFAVEDFPDSRLWRSTNFGESWTQVPGINRVFLNRDSTLFALRNSPFLQRSDDNGQTWQTLDTAGISPWGKISNFFLAGHRIFIVMDVPWLGDLLFVTEDDGKTWQPSQPFGLAGYSVFSLAGTGNFAVATAHRPALTQDGGKTWAPFTTGLPPFTAAAVGADSNYIYVVVSDRGLWRLPLADLNFKTVSGEVYYDLNLNKQRDPGEPPAPGAIVSAQPAGVQATTDDEGRYALLLNLPAGAGEAVSAHTQLPFQHVFPSSLTVTQQQTLADFGIQALPFGTDMGVYASMLRPILQGRDFQILLTVRNEGGLPAGGRVYFNPDPKAENYQTEPAADGVSGDSLYWDIPALSPGNTYNVRITGHIPASAQYGLEYHFRAGLTPPPADLNAANNSASIADRTYPVYWPVWKTVHREEIFWDEIQNGEKPVYTISFRNPFPDTVQRVRIVDYLEIDHDPATLQVLASSHPVRVQVQADGYTEFFFDDIALPDTITDPDALGHVVFSVGLRPGTPPETYLHNNASVFFDEFWPPHGGGTVQVHIAARATTGIAEPPAGAKDAALRIVPNPNTGAFRVQTEGFAPGNSTVRVFSQTGMLCLQQEFSGAELQIDLSPGLYWVQLTDNRKTAVGKMVVLRR